MRPPATDTHVEVDTQAGRVRGLWRADAAGTTGVYDAPSSVADDGFASVRPLLAS